MNSAERTCHFRLHSVCNSPVMVEPILPLSSKSALTNAIGELDDLFRLFLATNLTRFLGIG